MKVYLTTISLLAGATAFAQVTTSTAPVPTPRSQPIGPVGPGTANNPPVVAAPNQVGTTFSRTPIGGPPPSATTFGRDASVPTAQTLTPGTTPVTPQGVLGNSPVVVTNFGLPGSFATNGVVGGGSMVGANPIRVPNFATPVPNLFSPLNPQPATVFEFPPGSTIVTNFGAFNANPLPPVMPAPPLSPVTPRPLNPNPAAGIGGPGASQFGRGSSVTPGPVVPAPPLNPRVIPPVRTPSSPVTTRGR